MELNFDDQAEIWKIIDEFPLYQVSNFGRVRIKNTSKIKTEKRDVNRRKNGTVSASYLVVILKNPGGKKYRRYIHRLVAIAFLEPPSHGQTTVDHIDTNTHNNHVSNLRWASMKDQAQNKRAFNKWPISTEDLPHHDRIKILLDKENIG